MCKVHISHKYLKLNKILQIQNHLTLVQLQNNQKIKVIVFQVHGNKVFLTQFNKHLNDQKMVEVILHMTLLKHIQTLILVKKQVILLFIHLN